MKALAAEVAGKLGAALQPLSLRVRELTGDMQLTKKEMAQTQVLVVTPEKWDVVTRKGAEGVAGLVGLLILDEVSQRARNGCRPPAPSAHATAADRLRAACLRVPRAAASRRRALTLCPLSPPLPLRFGGAGAPARRQPRAGP